ncbi:DUF2070 family protein [Geoglobus ahangari]
MIDQNILEKFYSKIFSVPKKRVSVAIGITSIVLASYLNGISGKSFFAMRYFFIGLALLALLLFFGRLLGSGFNSRRIFFFALFMLVLIEIADVIAIHLLSPELIVVSPSAIAFILSVALYFTSERFSYLAPLLILALLYPVDYLFSFSAPHRGLAYALSSLAGVSLSYLFVSFMSGKAGRIVVSDILRDFVLYWLKGEPGIFERRIKMYSEVREGKVFVIRVGDATLIAPEFHPGPFRDIGGAKLVERALGRFSMFLHAASTHATNPSTGEDVEAIIRVTPEFEGARARKPYSVEGKRFRLKIYPFTTFTLIIIHGKESIDDIPSEVRDIAERFFANPIVVDGHNAYAERYELTPEDMTEIYMLMEKASQISPDECGRFEAYFTSADYESQSICGKLALLLMSFEGERHGILMVDANNMDIELREYLERVGKKYGVELDIITTDNHSKTGVSPKIGYKPAGMVDAEAIESFLERAMANAKLSEVEVEFGVASVRVTVMGERFFKDVDAAFKNYGERAMYLFILFSALNYALTFALSSVII